MKGDFENMGKRTSSKIGCLKTSGSTAVIEGACATVLARFDSSVSMTGVGS